MAEKEIGNCLPQRDELRKKKADLTASDAKGAKIKEMQSLLYSLYYFAFLVSWR